MYDELVKKLRRCGKGLCTEDCPDWTKENLYHTCQDELVLEAADTIEELSKPRWIPVTKRLPDESGNYLTAFGDGMAMAVNEFMHPRGWLTEEGREAHPNGKWYWGGVTHWMPLPEPPKEEA